MKFTRKPCLLVVLLALAPLLYYSTARAASYEFTTIDVPDAIATFMEGINDHGQVVGGYMIKTEEHTAYSIVTVTLPPSMSRIA